MTETGTGQWSEAWENDVTTGSRDRNAYAGYRTAEIPGNVVLISFYAIAFISALSAFVVASSYKQA